ncbi:MULTISPECIES: thioredoxin family protein [unclassified Planococcus (in: firmicutes)]|uniref:thioredoxin family protein n=1 Tax=unclassified Planococcus (in: firmicutes) TaxID=2662419 RepID=UPI000C338C68|nr:MULTISPECIES: thioredoxin family protein [unclassified Planococcus (in: firmicutes)]AUD13491.1 thiol reductase thioredoxin [Planococcus sp. MB-3u-03]PKG46084.1 thiol reductase thioredoxin [Planococcus sp. Urea-trap-24]PKG89927.1 thiol reductase thioredoxin [Planococcus sp. Urea-3u-39]PKH40548.1 thiol reductase thioredoxin [Planococcus sp. MB-3u-09]
MNEWTHKEWLKEKNTQPVAAYYLYTPMCGTCQVASKMLGVVAELLPGLPMGKANLNYVQEVAELYEVESVPCLLISQDGKVTDKVYAFQSVPYLYEKLKSVDEYSQP